MAMIAIYSSLVIIIAGVAADNAANERVELAIAMTAFAALVASVGLFVYVYNWEDND